MKIFNGVCCILFLICAVLQYNDVDPVLWIILYLYAAWLCYSAARGRHRPHSYLIGIGVYLAFVLYYLLFRDGVTDWLQHHPASDLVRSMKADRVWIEESRETLGLLIMAAVLTVNWFTSRRQSGL